MRNASAKSGVLVSLGERGDVILQLMRNATDMPAHNIDMLMIGSWGNLPETLQCTKPRMRHAALPSTSPRAERHSRMDAFSLRKSSRYRRASF